MKLRSMVRKILLVIIISELCVAALSGLVLWYQGGSVLSVQTGSMVPAMRPGDGVVITKAPIYDLHIGDVISYRSPADNRVIVSHRIVSINLKQGSIITKGDHLAATDLPVGTGTIVGRVSFVMPKLGYAIDVVHRPIGLIFGIYLPALCILATEARRLARHFTPQVYRRYGYR